MINPYKVDYRAFWALEAFVLVCSIIILGSTTFFGGSFLIVLSTFLGLTAFNYLWIRWFSKKALHTRVKNPVKVEGLVIGQIYYLNGQTYAKFLGQNQYTLKFGFSIFGINKPDNATDITYLYKYEVETFLSAVAEV